MVIRLTTRLKRIISDLYFLLVFVYQVVNLVTVLVHDIIINLTPDLKAFRDGELHCELPVTVIIVHLSRRRKDKVSILLKDFSLFLVFTTTCQERLLGVNTTLRVSKIGRPGKLTHWNLFVSTIP